jgi:hypothetical protein
MKIFGWAVLIMFALFVLSITGSLLGWFGRAQQVVEQQVDPFVLQQKYEWFKDAAAQLDAKKADISVYDSRFKAIGGKIGECPAGGDRVAREHWKEWPDGTWSHRFGKKTAGRLLDGHKWKEFPASRVTDHESPVTSHEGRP